MLEIGLFVQENWKLVAEQQLFWYVAAQADIGEVSFLLRPAESPFCAPVSSPKLLSTVLSSIVSACCLNDQKPTMHRALPSDKQSWVLPIGLVRRKKKLKQLHALEHFEAVTNLLKRGLNFSKVRSGSTRTRHKRVKFML